MFNFDSIVAKIPAVEQYKKDHYYTNYYNRCLDEYDWDKELIEVEDWEGRKGVMTYQDFAKLIGTSSHMLYIWIEDYKNGDVSPVFIRRMKNKFKKINFREVN